MGLARQIRQNILYRGIFIGFQFLNTLLISRLAGPVGYGQYSLLIVNAGFLLTITSMGLPSGILFHSSSRDISPAWLLKLTWSSTVVQLMVIASIDFILFMGYGDGLLWQPENVWLSAGGFLFTISIILTEKYYALYNGYGFLLQYHKLLAGFNVLLAIILIACSSYIRENINTVLYIFVGTQVLQLLFLAVWYSKHQPSFQNVTEASTKLLYGYAIHAFFSNLLYFLMTRIDVWMVEYFYGTGILGVYALPVRLIQMTLILPSLLASIILPKITSGELPPKMFESVFRMLASLNMAIIFAAFVFSPWLLPFIFGTAYSSSVYVLLWLLPGAFFLSMQIYLAAYFAGKGKLRINMVSMIVGTILAMALYLWLIPEYGINGAAIASSLAYAVSFLYSYWQYCKQTGYTWSKLFIRKEDIQRLQRIVIENKLVW